MKNDFTLSVSNERYDDKNTIDWGKVQYSRIDDLALENIAEIITDGYCFTSIYKKESFSVFEKTESNWMGSDFVIFDIDNIKNEVTFSDYLSSLSYTPTIAYTTPNHHQQKPTDLKPFSRFRLLYAFNDTITDKWQYQSIYETISNTFDKALFDTTKKSDNCGKSPIQQYSGNATKNCQIIVNETIYNIEDFKVLEPTEKPIKKDDLKVKIDDDFLQKLNTLKPTDFLAYYRDSFQILFETELKYNDNGFALIPDDYVRIQRNYTIYKEDGKICSKYKRLRDGERRRHTLFCNAKIRCQIKPQISVEELIFNLVYDRYYFYDNSDNVLTNQCLLRIALDAKKATYQMTMKNKPFFKVDSVFCKENNIKPNALKMMVRKTLHYDEIKQWYDTTKSVKDNLLFAKENNIKVSRATLYNYCGEKGINPKGEKIKEPINKAVNDAISSVKKVDGTINQTQQENALNRKIKHIQYAPNDELTNYINKTKNTMYFAAYPTKIMSLNMVI